jgi:RNA polymerase sigma factor (sigma-70 family)
VPETSNIARQTDDRGDAELVAAARGGDDRAYEALYARYRRRIAAYVHGMVGDWGRAEDVTQEVFISALRRMRETDRPIAFKPWVFEIAKNASIDHFRRTRRTDEVSYESADDLRPVEQARLAGTEPTPDAAAEVGQQLEHLRGAFGGLSDSHHRILVLREFEGLSYREIGRRMNLSRPGVESTLFRARRRLSEEYDDLSTGARCLRVRALFGEVAIGQAGVRERRRVERHLAWCRTCRVEARHAGFVTSRLVREGAVSRLGAFLPLPLLLRRGGGSGAALARSAASSPGVLGSLTTGWRGVAAALTLAAASTGAGLATQAGDPPVAHSADAATAPPLPARPAEPAPHRPVRALAPERPPRPPMDAATIAAVAVGTPSAVTPAAAVTTPALAARAVSTTRAVLAAPAVPRLPAAPAIPSVVQTSGGAPVPVPVGVAPLATPDLPAGVKVPPVAALPKAVTDPSLPAGSGAPAVPPSDPATARG